MLHLLERPGMGFNTEVAKEDEKGRHHLAEFKPFGYEAVLQPLPYYK